MVHPIGESQERHESLRSLRAQVLKRVSKAPIRSIVEMPKGPSRPCFRPDHMYILSPRCSLWISIASS